MGLFNILFFTCLLSSALKMSLASTYDVIKYGAVGNGKQDDTKAFRKAWEAACGDSAETPTLNIPSDRTFYLTPVVLNGPCQSSIIHVQIDGNLIAPSNKGGWKSCVSNTWIVFKSVTGLTIDGTGTLNGMGSTWWNGNEESERDERIPSTSDGDVCHKPTTIRLLSCHSAQITGIHLVNSGGNHMSIQHSDNIIIDNLNIQAPGNSPNTDGINLLDSKNIQIHNSFIGTGDDCIAISNNCFNVNISDITCGPGHGISVGSLGKNGDSVSVEGIYVQHCTFTGTQASARIKTWVGGSGYARNIHYDDITLDSVKSAIEINQHYTDHVINQGQSAVQISDIHFTNMRGTARKIILECSPNAPCTDIVVQEMNITSSSGEIVKVSCQNANVETSSINPDLPCSE